MTKLVGHDETLLMLIAKVVEERFLTIVGSGGLGKSSVALALARRIQENYEHGVWLTDLARVSQASQVPDAIASSLGFEASCAITSESLIEHLRDKTMLLIFDNCDHALEATASLATAILRGAPGIRILATSREPLCAEGERRYRLPSLSLPSESSQLLAADALRFSAVDLFVKRAAEKMERFVLTDADAPVVVDLCRKLDGLPLAIGFAADLTDTFGVRGLARHLAGGVQALSGGYRTALPRHQTLRSMIDWSYDWLCEPERIIFRRLSILSGDFTLERAIEVAAHDEVVACDVADGVVNLVTKSLVEADVDGHEPMYRLLETTRAYAREKLRKSGEVDLLVRFPHQEVADLVDQRKLTRD